MVGIVGFSGAIGGFLPEKVWVSGRSLDILDETDGLEGKEGEGWGTDGYG